MQVRSADFFPKETLFMAHNRSMMEVCDPIKNGGCRAQEGKRPCHRPRCGGVLGGCAPEGANATPT
jgi:hypothetical protein